MYEQMNIYDFIPRQIKYHKVVDDLAADLKAIFLDCQFGDEHYYAWEHAKGLGKRYSICVEMPRKMTREIWDEYGLDKLILKYKGYSLDVSISVVPRYGEDRSTLYITTLWATKGHKEV